MIFSATQAVGARVVLLSGDEEALRRRALGQILEISTSDGDFDLQTFEGGESPPSEWIASVGTAPFLSARRTVIVRHLLRAEVEVTSAALSNLPETALLVLVADEESGDESKQRRFAVVRKTWEKLVRDAKGHLADFSADPKQTKQAIKQEAQRLGKKISDAAAESLSEMTGASLSRASEELEKLAIFVGAEEQIREGDIRAVVVPSREWNVYRLIDAIVDGAVAEGLRQLRILVGSPTKAEEAAFSRILPTMSRQLRLMWQARLCVEARCSPDSAPPEVRRNFTDKPNLAKEPPYRQSRLMQQARRVDLDVLRDCFRAVSEADAKLKGIVDSFSGIETLEHMVLEMVQLTSLRPAVARA